MTAINRRDFGKRAMAVSLAAGVINAAPQGADLRIGLYSITYLGVWYRGEALATGGTGHGSALYGGEAAWAFDSIDLGVAGYGYNSLLQSNRQWTPVVLARLTERFRTRRNLEAAFTFGVGAGRPKGWTAWFQVALGVRFDLGPMFLGGELAFEQYDLLHLTAGLGVTF